MAFVDPAATISRLSHAAVEEPRIEGEPAPEPVDLVGLPLDVTG